MKIGATVEVPVSDYEVNNAPPACGCVAKLESLGGLVERVTCSWACPVCGDVSFEKYAEPDSDPGELLTRAAHSFCWLVAFVTAAITFATVYLRTR